VLGLAFLPACSFPCRFTSPRSFFDVQNQISSLLGVFLPDAGERVLLLLRQLGPFPT